ncbi:hypothetical protein MRX96_022959 [Rhipicephalus microplus]
MNETYATIATKRTPNAETGDGERAPPVAAQGTHVRHWRRLQWRRRQRRRPVASVVAFDELLLLLSRRWEVAGTHHAAPSLVVGRPLEQGAILLRFSSSELNAVWAFVVGMMIVIQEMSASSTSTSAKRRKTAMTGGPWRPVFPKNKWTAAKAFFSETDVTNSQSAEE